MFRLLILYPILSFGGCQIQEQVHPLPGKVQTTSGWIQGAPGPEGTTIYSDIPFAQPPVGFLRWTAPQPILQPNAELKAQDRPILCPQRKGVVSGTSGAGFVGDEDCLYLDIYSPNDARKGKKLPVMFWIHGGSNLSGYKGTYDFSRLAARQKVMVVVVNYRLGPLGWFAHPALNGAALDEPAISNFGILDLIEALEWTRQNLSDLGGDVQNITIFGESAGGRNIYSLLSSPLTAGLFQKAIAQSGHVRSVSRSEAYNQDRRFQHLDRGSWEVVNALGFDDARVTSDELRAVPAHEFLEAYFSLPHDHIQPTIIADGVVIPEIGVLRALADPNYAKHIPVLAGTTRDEVSLWLGLNHYYLNVTRSFGDFLPPKLRIKEPEKFRFWVRVRSQGWKLAAVDEPFKALNHAGYKDLFAYRYDWDEQADNNFVPFSEILGASHASELAFIMGKPMYGDIGQYMYPQTASAYEMTEIMMEAWGEFAKTGAPSFEKGPIWPHYHVDNPFFMRLDVRPNLILSKEVVTLQDLLDDVSETNLLSTLESCLLVWELLTTVGRPDYRTYEVWEQGTCLNIDAGAEKRLIAEQLISNYGSIYYPE